MLLSTALSHVLRSEAGFWASWCQWLVVPSKDGAAFACIGSRLVNGPDAVSVLWSKSG